MKITTLDNGAVRITSDPDSNGVIHETNGKDLPNAHLAMVRLLRNAVLTREIDFADYTIYHVDLARAILSPLGRQLWPAQGRNAPAYTVVETAYCPCGTCQAIREEQGRHPLDTCAPKSWPPTFTQFTFAEALAEAKHCAQADGQKRYVIQVDPHYVQGGVLRYAVCTEDDLPDDAELVPVPTGIIAAT